MLLATNSFALVPVVATGVPPGSLLVSTLTAVPTPGLPQGAPQVLAAVISQPPDSTGAVSGQSLSSVAETLKSALTPPAADGQAAPPSGLGALFTVVYAPSDLLADPTVSRILASSPAPASSGSTAPTSLPSSSSSLTRQAMDEELTPSGIGTLTLVPDTSEVTLRGLLQTDHSWMTYRMPVDSRTQSLNLSVKSPDPAPSSVRPAVDELYLVDQTGLVLAEVKGAAANSVGPRQDLAISLGSSVPVGSELLVRVIEAPLPTTASQTTDPVAQGATAGPVPFIMDVKRTEAAGPSLPSDSSTASPGNAAAPVGTLTLTSISASASLPARSETSQPATLSELPAVQSGSSSSPLQAGVTSVASKESDPPPSTAVGPMVSVGSAPLGPPLGTAGGSLTLSVDRNERAFDLALEGSAAGIDPELIRGVIAGYRNQDGNPTTGAAAAGISSGSIIPIAIQGPGGYPVLGFASGQEADRLNPEEVLATLSPTEAQATDSEGIAEHSPLPPLEAPEAPATGRRHVAAADFLTAACGIVLGVSLTSGPLYPDFLSLLRRTRPRYYLPVENAESSPADRRGRIPRLLARLGLSFGKRSASRSTDQSVGD
jgi:hypothetical protein